MRNSNDGMVHHNDYVAGWLDSSIRDFLEHFPRTSQSMAYALITCLDSNLAPSSLLARSPELKPVLPDGKKLKAGILLPTARMLEVEAGKRIFFGFDEVWFFPNDKIEPKPESAWLVGPNRIDQRKLDKLGSWMAHNGCSLGLGDGDGLNFLVKARGLVKYLLGFSMYQPAATTGGEIEEVRKVSRRLGS